MKFFHRPPWAFLVFGAPAEETDSQPSVRICFDGRLPEPLEARRKKGRGAVRKRRREAGAVRFCPRISDEEGTKSGPASLELPQIVQTIQKRAPEQEY